MRGPTQHDERHLYIASRVQTRLNVEQMQSTPEPDMICPRCQGTKLVQDSQTGELVCSECGLVIIEGTISPDKEWRSFDSEEFMERSRAGAPVSPAKVEYGLETQMTFDRRTRSTYFLRRAQRQSRTRRERNVLPALFKIRVIAEEHNLPTQAVEDAAILYRKASSAGLVKGRNMDAMVAACIYASCRRTEVPRSLREIASFFDLKEKEVGASFRFLFKSLGIAIPPVRPEIYVSRICSDLRLPQSIATGAIRIIKVAREVGTTLGKEPVGVAAAAVYLACQKAGKHRTQREFAQAAGVTEVTVRSRYRELIEKVLPALKSRNLGT